jgi:heat-inducible transcriptional repressor
LVWGDLGERPRQVLQAVIFEYIVTAEPVGSRQLARKYALGLSPATIRNAMADLEEMGYLTHPHTSAGRVPTDKAYRFYVDAIAGTGQMGRPDALRLQRQMASTRSDIDELMETTSAQLAALSHYAAVILAPPLRQTRLDRIDLIPIAGDRALVVIATETGWGTSRILTLDEAVKPAELREIARVLTDRFGGLSFQEIRARVGDAAAPADADRLERLSVTLARKAFASLWDKNLFYSGAIELLDQPEFAHIPAMKAILRTFEEKRQLIELLTARASNSGEVQVVVPLVEYTARLVSRRLTRLHRTESFT